MNVVRLVGCIFAFTGAVLLVIAGVLYQHDTTFAAHALRANGEVIDIIPSRGGSNNSVTYASRVRFTTAEGRTVEIVDQTSSRPARHAIGDQVTLLYDAASPAEAVIDDFAGRWLGLVIVGGLAAVFGPLGLAMLVASWRASRRKQRLQQDGQPVDGEFLGVFQDESLTINGAHPFRVSAQAKDPRTGLLRRFDSSAIWVDPTAQLAGKPVRILLGSGSEYLVDLRGIVDESAHAG